MLLTLVSHKLQGHPQRMIFQRRLVRYFFLGAWFFCSYKPFFHNHLICHEKVYLFICNNSDCVITEMCVCYFNLKLYY